MNNAGRQTDTPDTVPAEDKPKRSRFSGLFLPVVGLLVVGAAILMLQLVPILYGILLPPMPPLPAGVTELSHRNISYGVDEWTYVSPQNACDVAEFYVQKGGDCPPSYMCVDKTDTTPLPSGQVVAQCGAVMDFSVFKMRWIATISSDNTSRNNSVFQVSREVFWGGEVPPKFEDLVSEIEHEQTATPGN